MFISATIAYQKGTRLYGVVRLGSGSTNGKADYARAELKAFEKGINCAYNSNGWRPIAFGYYKDTGHYWEDWRRAEEAAFQLRHEDILALYETYGARWMIHSSRPETWTKKRLSIIGAD